MTPARQVPVALPALCRIFPVLVLACTACKQRPVVCEGGQFHEALQLQAGGNTAPIALDRHGAVVAASELETVPQAITFVDDRRVRTEWLTLGHIAGQIDLVYSPEEEIARSESDPRVLFSLKRLDGGGAGRVRLGFRSARCAVSAATDGGMRCEKYTEQPQPMIGEMSCEAR